MAKVALIKGNNRYQNVRQALDLIKEDVGEKIKGKKKIVIKPNFVSTEIQLAATHLEAVRAILDFLKPLTKQKIIIAEGAALGSTETGFKNFDYYDLAKDYNLEFIDLNKDDFVEVELFDHRLEPFKTRLAKTIVESDFRISPAMLKTHDTVIVTLSLKNMVVGPLLNKVDIHQGAKAINLSLAKLAEVIPPHLAVIDGFIGMQGDGPVHGEPIQMNLALAGLDFLAVDTLGAYLMGFNPEQVGYLYYCKQKGLGQGDIKQIDIIGNTSLRECCKKFKPHSTFQNQLKWK